MKTAVVYGIKNKQTGMYYVGSARDLEARWNYHKSLLEAKGKAHTQKLQDAWDASSPANWEWLVLENNIPLIHQFHSEQHWIDTLDSYNHGYNSSPRAGSYIELDNRGYQSIVDEREDDVLEMLAQIKSGKPYRHIASAFGVSLGFLTKLKKKFADLLSDVIDAEQQNKVRIQSEKADADRRKAYKYIRDRRVEEMINAGHTYREVSKTLGCSLGTVSKVVNRTRE